jgi:hypothetical protein
MQIYYADLLYEKEFFFYVDYRLADAKHFYCFQYPIKNEIIEQLLMTIVLGNILLFFISWEKYYHLQLIKNEFWISCEIDLYSRGKDEV